ncbi:MAG TPA: PASTA domain-containing protein [Desulfobacterales bacterium]|nr:PASTA domain-containing protein [Desulfobacterales bacterium]
MPGIFISYRREDTAGHAGRIFDRLRATFGRDKVFMDVTAIEPGVDFVEAIDRAVGSCDVLLVIIGKQWLNCHDAAGRNRLDDPKDFIRLETATALRRNIRVIPVLVQGATMPGEDDLPDDLKKLARRQATEISDTHWDASFEQLIETLENVLTQAPTPAQPGTAKVPHAPVPMEEKPEPPAPVPWRWVRNRRTWIMPAIAAMAVVLAGLLFMIGPDKVVVPDLLGMSVDAAVARLEQANLRPGTTRAMPSEHPAGSVIEQDPAPGGALAPDSAVNLVLAEQRPDTVEAPDLMGFSLDEASARLARESLRLGTTRAVPSERPAGSVIEQDPAPGSALAPDSAVNLVLAERRPESEAPPQVVMATVPKLVGQPLEKAHLLLEKAGLKPAKAVRRETDGAPEGTVIEQSPQAGSMLPRGEKVELVVASSPAEPERVAVPDVRGLDVKRAVVILKDARLNAKMERVETTKAEPGTVLKQSLKPGSQVGINETVLLIYAVVPRDEPASGEIVLPDFTGAPIQRVEVFLRETGLVLGPVHERVTSEQRPGTVLGQKPPAKTRVAKGAEVLLLVAVGVADEGSVLPAPEQIWPEEGRIFDNFPRTTVVKWTPVSRAASYTVELDCLHCCESGTWCSELGRPWKVVRDIPAVASPGHKFEFAGAQTGRWRVWAVDENGREGAKSPWRTFRYTK